MGAERLLPAIYSVCGAVIEGRPYVSVEAVKLYDGEIRGVLNYDISCFPIPHYPIFEITVCGHGIILYSLDRSGMYIKYDLGISQDLFCTVLNLFVKVMFRREKMLYLLHAVPSSAWPGVMCTWYLSYPEYKEVSCQELRISPEWYHLSPGCTCKQSLDTSLPLLEVNTILESIL